MRLSGKTPVNVRGVLIDPVTLGEAADILTYHLNSGDTLAAVYTPNSEIVDTCIGDTSGRLTEMINSAELTVADGIGVVKAAKILGTPLPEKVAGIDLGTEMLRRCAETGIPVFLMGSTSGTAELARDELLKSYPGLSVAGTEHGYFEKRGEESDRIVRKIAASGAKLLFVCLGAPAQEIWIRDNKTALSEGGVLVAMGLGGTLDVFAGKVNRAPKIFISLGLEWLYRLVSEPSRMCRMRALPRFYFGVIKYSRLQKRAKKRKEGHKSIQ